MIKTKTFFSGIILFLLVLPLTAQVKINPEIQKKVNAFIELSNQKSGMKHSIYCIRSSFTHVPKQDLIDLMTGMEQDGMSLQRGNIKLLSASTPFEEGNESFVRLEYTGDLIVQIAPASLYDAPKSLQGMLQQFETSYGIDNVAWDPATKKYTIKANIAMMAIHSGNEWYLIEINAEQKELMEFLFQKMYVVPWLSYRPRNISFSNK